MTTQLSKARCFRHAHREAVARCPECGRYFCRECVTEHDGRVLCAACLGKSRGGGGERGQTLGRVLRTAACVVGFLALWCIFIGFGRLMTVAPAALHDDAFLQGEVAEP